MRDFIDVSPEINRTPKTFGVDMINFQGAVFRRNGPRGGWATSLRSTAVNANTLRAHFDRRFLPGRASQSEIPPDRSRAKLIATRSYRAEGQKITLNLGPIRFHDRVHAARPGARTRKPRRFTYKGSLNSR